MNFIQLEQYKIDLEGERQEILRLKFETLKRNNATCYAEIPNELDQYKYRKYTQNLRYINKLQDEIYNELKRINSLYIKAWENLRETKKAIDNAR